MFERQRKIGPDRDWMSVEEMWDAYPERFFSPGFGTDDVPVEVVEAARLDPALLTSSA